MNRTIFSRLCCLLICMQVGCAAMAQTTTVRRGETFTSIAEKYGVTEHALRSANPNVKTCNGKGLQDKGLGLGFIKCGPCGGNEKCMWCAGRGTRS